MYRIRITPAAKAQLAALDAGARVRIASKIDTLTDEPDKRGKPLQGSLAGFRSLRAAGQRYRVIYRVEQDEVIVIIVAIGIRREGDRRDIYSLMKKLLKSGLLE